MANLKMELETAKRLFPSAVPELQEIFKSTFGEKEFFIKITDRVKTFEDACEVLGISSDRKIFTEGSDDEIAYLKLKVITRALNEGWKPNWKDSNEAKFYLWWNMESGFSLYDVYDRYRSCYVGSRLCFKTRELAEYAAKQFIALYKDYIV